MAPSVPAATRGGHGAAARSAESSTLSEEESPAAQEEERAAPLDEIEIRLAFDLGEKTLRLRELSSLQPGQVIPLDAPPARLIAIRANGRLIGRGELVRVDARVAVRVIELASSEHQESAL